MISTPSPERQQRYRRGWRAEAVAGAYLTITGHRILARRYKAHCGEIDLIICRRGRVGFVEVKARKSLEACEASISGTLARRVRDAADHWLARHPEFQSHDLGFDLVFVVPWRLPVVRYNGL